LRERERRRRRRRMRTGGAVLLYIIYICCTTFELHAKQRLVLSEGKAGNPEPIIAVGN
jgi:hypothetical protein